MSESIYIGRQSNNILVSIAIPEDKGRLDWTMCLLVSNFIIFTSLLLDVKPIDVTQDFIQGLWPIHLLPEEKIPPPR
ncbi:hypothetical protein OS493_040634 [Desmophyllum pertusum]|uniref:Uncharacterized protein n=1 Tax=Desmophyllum pertusum TaxID=174260 RepID=A0A9W9ZUC5_9CNID|nr:hypothetical protein OS493_040634 [Desmophyllum pertusum]